MIREQRIKSGKMLEVKFYPVFSDGREIPRGPKRKKTDKAQAEYNKKQSIKQLVRLINANFDESDLLMHPTYTPFEAPRTLEEARRDIVNYLRRVKNFRKNLLKKVCEKLKQNRDDEDLKAQKKKLSAPFKYAYGIEVVEYKSGPLKGKFNFHFHLFMTGWGGRDRDEAELMWNKGIRTNCDRFRPKLWGPESAARYVAKAPAGSRRFSCSKNMDKPIEEEPRDGKVTPLEVERMVKRHSEDRTYWENRHKGYEFLGFEKAPEECYNAYNGFYYLTVKLYKKDPVPQRKKSKCRTVRKESA